jgi:2-polyprenyl-3-methyl-5-hydroxy-6-metoxy-1,4-benzoquinol methylase
MNCTRDKWNCKYADCRVEDAIPCRALKQFAHLLPQRGKAMDVACGLGGNAVFLAQHGLDTLAVDIADGAVNKLAAYASARGLPLRAECRDLEQDSLPAGTFDVIVVAHYLERALVPALPQALAPRGLLVYQTFTQETPTHSGPMNPEWRLKPGELLQLFPGLRTLVYCEEGLVGDTKLGLRGEAFLIASRVTD